MKESKNYEIFKKQLKTCGEKLNAIKFDKGQAATTFTDPYYKYMEEEEFPRNDITEHYYEQGFY